MKIHHQLISHSFRKPVVTIGIFDGVHTGHMLILEKLNEIARSTGGESVVVTLWPHPRMVLNPDNHNLRLLNTLEEKQQLLAGKGIDHLVILPFTREFSQLSSCEFISEYLVERIGVHHLVVGFNHHFGKDRQGDIEKIRECAADYHFTLEKLDARMQGDKEVSSSLIREMLESGRMTEANSLLGYAYNLTGRVVPGSQVGRTLDFPTANIQPDYDYKLVPPSGVYAVGIKIRGSFHYGMLNIGYRPTLNEPAPRRSIEVNVFDWQGDLYAEELTVWFYSRLRDEMRFPDLGQLKQQLEKDKINALNVIANIVPLQNL